MGTGAPVMELRGYPRASYSPSIKGDEIDSASSAALRLCSPKNFCSPIFFPKLFYPTSFFFSPGPCFHFTANTIWFGFHDIPAQRLSHSAGALARRRHTRLYYTESKRRHAGARGAHASPKNNKSLINCLKRPIPHMHSVGTGLIFFHLFFSV